MNERPWEELKLGQAVYEADPWDRKVYVCKVIEHITYESYDVRLCQLGKTVRDVKVSGGRFGFGVMLDADNWGTTYFEDKEQARRVGCERAVELEKESREQIQKEIEELEGKLSQLGEAK